jgi:large exoprotein involved in heme utilization and adhesion
LFTETDGTGRGGHITFAADTITFDGGIGVFTDTFGSGTSGDITITGRDVAIRFSASIGAFAQGSNSGGTGDVTVTADSLLIAADGAVRITGLTSDTSGAGDAGDVLVQAKSVVLDGLQNLEFERGGAGLFFNIGLYRAGVASGSSGSGAAGDVTVIADSVSVLGNAIIESATVGTGAGGTVAIKARIIEIREGARFFAGTGGAGDAGSIVVEADRLSLSNDTSPFFSSLGTNSFGSAQLVRGNAGDIIVNVGTLELLTGGVLRATIAAPAKGGDVLITADRVVISGDGTVFPIDEFTPFRPSPGNFTGIVSSGVDITSGDAGNITINAGSIEIGGGAVIASTVEGVGSGGAITLNSGVLTMTEGARLDASTFGPGAGGNIVVNVTGDVLVNGQSGGFLVESFSTEPDAGLAGSIFVNANTLSVENGAQISTNSAVADGGNIDIQVAELVFVSESAITTSVGDGSGAGGNILIDPQFVVLNDARIQANAFGGPGGNILIVATNFVASPGSVVEASSQLGIDGNVTIDASQRDLVGQVVVLPDELLDATQQLAEQCSARGGKTLATFVGRGRSGLPQQPGGVIFAEYSDGDPAASASRGSMLQPGRLQISCNR